MALTRGFVTNGATTALDTRLMDMTILKKGPTGASLAGVLYTADTAGRIATPNASMQITMLDRVGYLLSRGATDGAIRLWNQGAVSLTIATAPTSNLRFDVVYIKQDDSTAGDADSLPVFGVVTGTAAASPTVPAVPTGALALIQVTVPANAATTNAMTLTQVAIPTSIQGGVGIYGSNSQLPPAANASPGDMAYVKGDPAPLFNGLYRYSPGFGAGTSEVSAGWYPVSVPVPRYQYANWSLSTAFNGTVLNTIVWPALPFAYRAIVRIGSEHSNGTLTSVSRVVLTAPGATVTGQAGGDPGVSNPASSTSQFYTEKIVDIPANTQVTGTFTVATNNNLSGCVGLASSDIKLLGEF